MRYGLCDSRTTEWSTLEGTSDRERPKARLDTKRESAARREAALAQRKANDEAFVDNRDAARARVREEMRQRQTVASPPPNPLEPY